MDETKHNPGGHFRFKVGQRVTVTFSSGRVHLGRIVARTVEDALGKVYQVRDQRGLNLGYVPEGYLTAR